MSFATLIYFILKPLSKKLSTIHIDFFDLESKTTVTEFLKRQCGSRIV
jgi:hypothetical protein